MTKHELILHRLKELDTRKVTQVQTQGSLVFEETSLDIFEISQLEPSESSFLAMIDGIRTFEVETQIIESKSDKPHYLSS